MIFSPNDDGVILMRAVNADRYSGGLVQWLNTDDDTVIPSGHTWDKTLSGRLKFTVQVTSAGAYDLLARLNTGGRDCWLWVEVDGDRKAVGPKSFGRTLHNETSFQWSDGGGLSTVTLTVGLHQICIYSLTAGLELDALALVSAGNAVPNYDSNNFDIEAAGEPPKTVAISFVDWLNDENRDQYRVVLVELDHSEGTVRLSDIPWISRDNNIYDDWLINDTFVESTLTNFLDIGDVQAINPDLTENWEQFNWRGYKARLYYGDVTWQKSEFRQIASATIEAFRPTGDREYRWDLVSETQKYQRTFHAGEDTVETRTVEGSIEWLLSQFKGSGAYQFINVTPAELDIQLSFAVTESTTMESLIYLIADSIGASVRISQAGFLEIIIPDRDNPAPVTIDENSIVGSLRVVDTVYPVTDVVVTYNQGENQVSAQTGAQTGVLEESVTIETALISAADAQALADKTAPLYSVVQNTWEVEAFGVNNLIQIADLSTIEHPQLSGTGVASTVRQTPLSRIGRIEVTV